MNELSDVGCHFADNVCCIAKLVGEEDVEFAALWDLEPGIGGENKVFDSVGLLCLVRWVMCECHLGEV